MRKQSYLLAVIALTACFAAQATLPTGNDPFALSIPDMKGGVEMNVGGMLAKPSGGYADNGITSTGPGKNVSSSAGGNAQASPEAGVGYGIPGSGNDIQVQWSSAR